MKKTILLLLFPILCLSQVSMNFGVTDIANRYDGETLTWSVGYTQTIKDFGLKANYRQTGVRGLNYTSADLMGIYRIDENVYRLDLGLGGSWNDLNKEINPIASLKNYFRIDQGLFITLDVEGVFRENFITHGLIGLSVDWIKRKRKPKRFF